MRTIFLLEDDEGIRDVLEILLSEEGYVVQSFASIEEFKSRDVTVSPNLYIFDVMLPDGSGLDLCREIKSHQTDEDIPVVIMSAHAHISDIKGICDPQDFISKPFDIDQLLERIKFALA